MQCWGTYHWRGKLRCYHAMPPGWAKMFPENWIKRTILVACSALTQNFQGFGGALLRWINGICLEMVRPTLSQTKQCLIRRGGKHCPAVIRVNNDSITRIHSTIRKNKHWTSTCQVAQSRGYTNQCTCFSAAQQAPHIHKIFSISDNKLYYLRLLSEFQDSGKCGSLLIPKVRARRKRNDRPIRSRPHRNWIGHGN